MRFALLTCVGGLKEDTWRLLVIGVFGMIQNIVAASLKSRPWAVGGPGAEVATFEDQTVTELERKHPQIGASLLPTLFPGAFREDEERWWNEAATITTR
jgi:hypothetical protein